MAEHSESNKLVLFGLLAVGVLVTGVIFLLGGDNSTTQLSDRELQSQLVPIEAGVQKAMLTAINGGYLEKNIVLRKDVPTELTLVGQTSGCASAIVARDFWTGIKQVNKGKIEVVSFTPTKTGTFKGACAMGMYTFNIQVI